MKFKTILATAGLLAIAGAANAAYDLPLSGNGTVVLTAYDPVLHRGYVHDLGIGISDFLTNPSSLVGFTSDSQFSSIFFDTTAGRTASATTDIKWNITAAENLGAVTDFSALDGAGNLIPGALGGINVLTSGLTAPSINNASITNMAGLDASWLGQLNAAPCSGNVICSGEGTGSTGDYWKNWAGTVSNGAALGQSTTLYHFSSTPSIDPDFGDQIYDNTVTARLINSFDLGVKLDTAGNLTVVPLPAAVWLFGAGLMGLIGVARRRRTV